jgi:hypothetical protein
MEMRSYSLKANGRFIKHNDVCHALSQLHYAMLKEVTRAHNLGSPDTRNSYFLVADIEAALAPFGMTLFDLEI